MIQNSLLDNDQYKFTMQQAVLKLGYAATPVEYKFKCRNYEGVNFKKSIQDIELNIDALRSLYFHRDELDYLRSLRFFSEEYIEFLKQYKFNTDLVKTSINTNTGELNIDIKGPWFQTILFEVPLMSIISEIFCNLSISNYKDAEMRLSENLYYLPEGLKFADFGTRRRRSYRWHSKVVKYCKNYATNNFIGTSNLLLAMKYNVKPIGTMAHEWLQAHQQLEYRLDLSQKMAFENWIKVYRGDLGIALSDVINTDAFLHDFDDPLLYKLFDGVREDSEPDPIQFGFRMVKFYKNRGIEPLTKTIVFSNGLDFEKAKEIYNALNMHIGVSFGIGTKLTNNFSNPALNMVIKMTKCNGQPVAKISNSPGKGMCENKQFVSYLKTVFNLEHN